MNRIQRILQDPKKYLSIDHIIKKSIAGRLFLFWMHISRVITDDRLYIKVFYLLAMGEKLDFNNPKTFTQKIQWLKLYNTDPQYARMVDKYEARQIINSKIGDDYLIPLYGVWKSYDDIEFNKLPNEFVLKTTHDSGTVIICNSKNIFKKELARKIITKSLKRNYFYKSREYPYKNAIPRVIAEKYMHDENQKKLDDYKFFCFSGVPKFLQVTKEIDGNKNVCYFDMNFSRLPFNTGKYKTNHSIFTKPFKFAEMIEIAKILSHDLIHVRIDLYFINDRIYFGEYTFHHNGGIIEFKPQKWNEIWGNLIKLPLQF